MPHSIYAVLALFLLAFVAGCGGNKQPLTGTVTFSDDGSPLTSGVVILESNGKMGRGEIDASGKFVMGFESDRDGIPKGETYKVTVVNALTETGKDKSGMPVMTSLIDAKYGSQNTSGITFTSDGNTKTLDLKVDRNTKK